MIQSILLAILRSIRWLYVSSCNVFTWLYNGIARIFGLNIQFHGIEEPLPDDAHIKKAWRFMFGKQQSKQELQERIVELVAQVQHLKGQSDRNFARYKREKGRAQTLDEELKKCRSGSQQNSHTPIIRSHEEVLGLNGSYTQAEAKAAYMRLVNRYHPDKHRHMSQGFQNEASVEFSRIVEAYEALSQGN
ncbi:MAG: DnaJ domain-containing protein [Gammaproteobacteria bacterium]|nr:DnaJ domain-containing protein [Gammaproteobacteria bacterium]